jgi:hypothetical protein
MKLYFTKDEQQEIVVQMSTGIVMQEFSYIEMIKGLLSSNNFEATDYSDEITDEEEDRIESMLSSINDSIVTKVKEIE